MNYRHRKLTHSCLQILLIFLLGILCYVNTLDVPFQLDDLTVIVENPLIRILYPFSYLFHYDPSRFLTHWTFAVNYHWNSLNVFWFHGVNIMLHCLNGVLFFWLLKITLPFLPFPQNQRIKKRNFLPFFAALIFIAHPLQTESVTYIVQRSVLLATAFYLAGLLGYIKLRVKFRWVLYFFVWIITFLGTMTKPIFITLPLTILLYEFYFLASLKRQKMSLLALPYALIGILIPLWIILFSLNYFSESFSISKWIYATRTTSEIPRGIYFLTECPVIVRYISLLFFPIGQNILHAVLEARHFWEGPTLPALLFLVGLAGYAFFMRRKKRLISFSIFWFFILLIPESTIFPLSDVMFEHRLYLAVGCFAVILVEGVAAFVKKNHYVIFGLIVLNLALLTYARNSLWKDPAGLLEDAIAKSPAQIQLHNALGILYEREGALSLALREFQKAETLDKNFFVTLNHLGRIYAAKKDFKTSEDAFKKALSSNPNYFEANFNLGNLYYLKQEWSASLVYYQRALDLKPNDHRVVFIMAKIYEAMKNFSEAERYYKMAIVRGPQALEAYYALGNLYLDQQNYDQAIPLYEQLLKMNPHYALAHNTLAIAYANTAQSQKAEFHFKEALRLNPNDATAYLNLAELYKRRGDEKNFEHYWNLAQPFLSNIRPKETVEKMDAPAF